jgi:hypothetical protein
MMKSGAQGKTIASMTPDEWRAALSSPQTTPEQMRQHILRGKQVVRERIAKGQPVSDEWLKSYPDLRTYAAELKRGERKSPFSVPKKKGQAIFGAGGQSQADDAMIAEARKYDTPEEFVKRFGTVVYRGSASGSPKFDISDWGKFKGHGFSVSFSKDIADRYALGKGTISGFIDQKSRIKDIGVMSIHSVNDFLDGLDKRGIDAIRFFGKETGEPELVILNKDIIKTNSQLTDIWNAAHGKGQKSFTTPAMAAGVGATGAGLVIADKKRRKKLVINKKQGK